MPIHLRKKPNTSMTWILALILIFASSFPYLFVGPLPLWIFFGLCAFGWAIKKRIVPAVFLSNRILFFLICSWLGLLLLTSILDATTLQSRDLMAGPGSISCPSSFFWVSSAER